MAIVPPMPLVVREPMLAASVEIKPLLPLAAMVEVTTPVPECDLVVSGVINGSAGGAVYDNTGLFLPDTAAAAALTRTELEDLLIDPADRLTFMCVPWGSGKRIGIDRDLDGVLNGDEI